MDDGPATEGSVDAAGAAALASPAEGPTAAKKNPNVGGGPFAAARWALPMWAKLANSGGFPFSSCCFLHSASEWVLVLWNEHHCEAPPPRFLLSSSRLCRYFLPWPWVVCMATPRPGTAEADDLRERSSMNMFVAVVLMPVKPKLRFMWDCCRTKSYSLGKARRIMSSYDSSVSVSPMPARRSRCSSNLVKKSIGSSPNFMEA